MQTMQQQQWLINIWHKRGRLDHIGFVSVYDSGRSFLYEEVHFFLDFFISTSCATCCLAPSTQVQWPCVGVPPVWGLSPEARGGGGDLVRGPGVWRPGLWDCPTLGQRGCVPARISPEGNKPFPPASLKRHHTYQLPESLQGTGSLNEVLRLV